MATTALTFVLGFGQEVPEIENASRSRIDALGLAEAERAPQLTKEEIEAEANRQFPDLIRGRELIVKNHTEGLTDKELHELRCLRYDQRFFTQSGGLKMFPLSEEGDECWESFSARYRDVQMTEGRKIREKTKCVFILSHFGTEHWECPEDEEDVLEKPSQGGHHSPGFFPPDERMNIDRREFSPL